MRKTASKGTSHRIEVDNNQLSFRNYVVIGIVLLTILLCVIIKVGFDWPENYQIGIVISCVPIPVLRKCSVRQAVVLSGID